MERQEIIKFLKNPQSYPYPVERVEHIQTYISDVFLTGKFAYKIKKPVNYGYLDFTTLAKRKFFVNQELKLNRRFSPEMYLDVVPIIKKEIKAVRRNRRLGGEGGFILGGRGKIVEYVLKMKEIPQQYLMYKQLRKKKVDKKIIDKLAKIVAVFHGRAENSTKIDKVGSLKIIKKNWQENFDQTESFIGKTIFSKDWQFIKKSIEKFIKKNKNFFQQRVKNKKIRDCHGDLHVGNIFLSPNKINIFDCLEFNDRFRYQDTVSEIAFLTMDLDFWGQQDLSDYFFKRYIHYSGDKISRGLFLFYKCYRAYVKGKVISFSIRRFSRSRYLVNKNFGGFIKNAKKYFGLAKKCAEEMQSPILIVGAGLPGIGRSTRLKILAKRFNMVIIDSDILRQQIKRTDYDQKTKFLVYQKMINLAEKYLRQGNSVILDATFSKEKYRQLSKELVKKLKIPYFLIEFYCSDKIARKRLLKRAKEKSISQADWQVYLKIKKELVPFKKEPSHFKINTAQTPEQCVREIIEKINF